MRRKRSSSDLASVEADEEEDEVWVEGAEDFESDKDAAGDSLVEVASKRDNLLERNRVAASKCRKKKKLWVHDLEEAKSDLELQHSSLQMQYNELLEEANQMKNNLIAHAGCHDHNIDRWIDREARRFVDRTTQERASDDPRPRALASGYKGLSSRSRVVMSTPKDLGPAGDAWTMNPDGEEASGPRLGGAANREATSGGSEYAGVNYDHMPDELFNGL